MKRTLAVLGLGVSAWVLWRRAFTKPYLYLNDKVVLITGASSGIGRAAAKAFAAQGAKLVLVARRAEPLNAVKAELEATYGTSVLMLPGDVTDARDQARIVETTLKEMGRIDVLVNNAGVNINGALDTLTSAQIQQVLDVNLRAVVTLTHAVLPHFRAQQSGHIVNVSTVGAEFIMPGQSVYSTAKSGVIAFSDAMRRELQGTGINVSTVLPGFVFTPMLGDYATPEEARQGMPELNIPGVSLDDPAVVGGAIVNAVRYNRREWVTGGILPVIAINLARVAPGLLDLLTRSIDTTPWLKREENSINKA